jgi:hypothetical protein
MYLTTRFSAVGHTKGRAAQHTPVPISERVGGGGDAGVIMCWKHKDQQVMVYCSTCSTATCSTCGLTQHHGDLHTIGEVGDMLPGQSKEVVAAVAAAQGTVGELQAGNTSIPCGAFQSLAFT